MISLMVVDDEGLVIKGIRSILKREDHGYILVGEAMDGTQAIRVAEQKKPDLIITDIRMPEMDGLEMIRQIRTFLPDTKFIILSGYGEFKYAQEAVRLGVIDYMLKPINSTGLYAVLDKVREQFVEKKDRRAAERNDHLKKLLGAYLVYKDDNALENLREMMDENSVYRLERISLKNHMTADFDRALYEKYGLVLEVENGLLLLFQDKTDAEISRINASFQSRMNGSILIDLSAGGRLPEVREQYDQVLHIGKMRFYTGEDQAVKTWGGERMVPMPLEMLHESLPYEILKMIEDGQVPVAMEQMENLVVLFEKEKIEPKDLTRYMQGVIRIFVSLLQQKGHLPDILPREMDEKIYRINDSADKWELLCHTKEAIQKIVDLGEEYAGAAVSRTVREVKRYILQNFQRDIGLIDAANAVFLNPKYLSDLFRKETGQSFSVYLTEVRMENAKRELCRMDLKVYEVAESVGYSNSKNFVKAFKRFTGMTPVEYRNSLP